MANVKPFFSYKKLFNCTGGKWRPAPIFLITLMLVSPRIFAVSSSYIDCRIATITAASTDPLVKQIKGRFTAGDGSGRKLLYGYPGAPWSSFTTVNIEAPGSTLTVYGGPAGSWLVSPYDTFDEDGNSMNTSTWAYSGIRITQDLSIVKNPFTLSRYDTIRIRYAVENRNTFTARVGLRIMLDTQPDGNDGSPVYTSTGGLVTQEEEFTGAAVPAYWYTQDDPVSPVVSAQGELNAAGADMPDMLIIGQWDYMNEDANKWDYAVHAQPITDSAVAAFYNPRDITKQATDTITAYFGLVDNSGAQIAMNKSADVTSANYGDTISYNIVYSDNTSFGLSSLSIWDTLPWNSVFIDASGGYSRAAGMISWNLPDLGANSGNNSLWVRVRAASQGDSLTNTAYASFIDSQSGTARQGHSNNTIVALPSFTPTMTFTVSPTFTVTLTPTITPTATISPTFTPTPPAFVFRMEGNFPNPGVLYSNFIFTLTRSAQAAVRIYTISGEFIIQLSGNFNTGRNFIKWNLKNLNGRDVAAGTYIFKMSVWDQSGEKAGAYGRFAVVR